MLEYKLEKLLTGLTLSSKRETRRILLNALFCARVMGTKMQDRKVNFDNYQTTVACNLIDLYEGNPIGYTLDKNWEKFTDTMKKAIKFIYESFDIPHVVSGDGFPFEDVDGRWKIDRPDFEALRLNLVAHSRGDWR